MPATENPPLIWVDLIEIKPLTSEQYADRYRGFTDTPARYREYRGTFQPWRLLIKSGDNEKRMFRSTERYFNRADAIHAAERCFGPGSNVYLREAGVGNRVLRAAT